MIPQLDTGDWPTWIQAVTTALALIAAAYAAVQTHRTLKLEIGRDEERLADERQREARGVSIWLEANTDFQVGENLLCYFYVANVNDSPVHNATLIFNGKMKPPDGLPLDPVDRTTKSSLFTVPPTGSRKREIGVATEIADSFVRDEMDITHNQFIDDAMNRMSIEIVFSDSAGRRWARNQHGQLRPVANDHELPALDEGRRRFGYSEEEIAEIGAPGQNPPTPM